MRRQTHARIRTYGEQIGHRDQTARRCAKGRLTRFITDISVCMLVFVERLFRTTDRGLPGLRESRSPRQMPYAIRNLQDNNPLDPVSAISSL